MEYGHGTVTEGTDCEHNDYYSKDGWWFCGHCHGFFSRRDDAKFCARLCKMEKERSDGGVSKTTRRDNMTIILPQELEDALYDGLTEITNALHESGVEIVGGLLGGTYGYGPLHYRNSVFQMHHFCWCERDDCPWCYGCTCPGDAWHYYVDGKEVSWEEWQNFLWQYLEEHGVTDDTDYVTQKRIEDEAETHRSCVHIPSCPYCIGEQFKEFGAEAGIPAPNFWHFDSGLKVWWYKYIGRGMETNMEVSDRDIRRIIEECLNSIKEE